MASVRRLIVVALLLLCATSAHAQTGSSSAMQQCQAYAASTNCWAPPSTCAAPQCNRGDGAVLAQCLSSGNGGATCTSNLVTVRSFPYDYESCELAPGTETARGINASGLQNGASGCDRDSNCATTFQVTDNYTVNGTQFAGGKFVTTGETCNVPADEPDDSEDVEDTHCETQGNLQVCMDDDEICVTAPSGRKYCWPKQSDPEPGCDHDIDDALCRDSNPPPRQDGRDDWRRNGGPVDVTNNGNTSTHSSHTNRPDSDGDGEGDDEDGDDDDDGSGDDDDENEPERTASLTDCGSPPSCDGDPIDCAHYITSWRHRCDANDDRTSGGAECSAPPSCTGDPIQCAQLSQMWRLRCDAEGSVVGGNTCDTEPTCKGDPVRCAIVRQQWLMRCRASDVTGVGSCAAPPSCRGDEAQCAMVETTWRTQCQGVISGGAIGNCNAPPTCDAGSAQCASVKALWRIDCAIAHPDEPPPLAPDDELFGPVGEGGTGVVSVPAVDLGGLDADGWGWSRSCPMTESVAFGASAVAMPVDLICGALSILGALIFLGGVAQAIYILGRGG